MPHVNASNQWVLDFINQCASFTGLTEEEDDSVDTMTMAISIWRQRGGGRDVDVDELVSGG